MGTTDHRGGLVPTYLENLKLGNENQLSELCDGMAGRTVTGVTDRRDPPFQNTSTLENLVQGTIL